MNSRKFWYYARRWIGVAIITTLFVLAGTMQKPAWLGAVVMGAIGFIFSASFLLVMSTHDPRDRQNCEDWQV